ncbi:hypothetical protein FACS1894200_09260 [Spirochaetia bacterium]|nr:hypothetical protein FACS1894200_09260 [Spirochaetia bacterium]
MDYKDRDELNCLLRRQSWIGRDAAEVFTWASLQEFVAALQSDSGVRIKDFTSHLMTKKEVKEEPECTQAHIGAKERVWRLEHIHAPDKYYILIRQGAKLNDYMTIIIHFDEAQYSETWHGVEIPHRLERFIERFAETLDEYNKCIHKIQEREKRAEKRAKIQQMRAKSLDLWLDAICESIDYPYCIIREDSKYVLSVLLSNREQVNFEIRLTNFEDVLPDLAAAIKRCLDTLETMPVRVLITNPKTSYPWKTNKNAN